MPQRKIDWPSNDGAHQLASLLAQIDRLVAQIAARDERDDLLAQVKRTHRRARSQARRTAEDTGQLLAAASPSGFRSILSVWSSERTRQSRGEAEVVNGDSNHRADNLAGTDWWLRRPMISGALNRFVGSEIRLFRSRHV
jgi:hypothetical protein